MFAQERKLVKLMENFKIEFDTTVREADGSVVQFQYGDDGYDAISVVRLSVPVVLEPYNRHMFDHDDEMALIREEDSVEKAANYLNWWRDEHGEKMVPCPVDMEALFERAKILSEGVTLKMSFNEVWTKCWDFSSSIPNELFRNYLILFLQVRRMRELGEDFFIWLLESAQEIYNKSKINPGEMVGVLAGQSVAE